MTVEADQKTDASPDVNPVKDKQALEYLFVLIIGAIILGAAITSLTYNPTSALAPWVVLAPLLLLIGIQINRLRKNVGFADIARVLSESAKGQNPIVVKVVSLFGWMIFLLGSIYLGGHYLGMMAFMFVLLYFKAKESLKLSILLTLIVTAVIFGLFEQVFSIELYRGLLFRSM